MYHNFPYLFICQWILGCFHVLAIVNHAAMNTGVHVCFKVVVFSVYMPNSGIFGSRGRFIPSFPKNFHIVLHSGCINLHSHKQYKKVPFSLHHFQDLLFVDFFFFFNYGHSDWCEAIPYCVLISI